MASDSVPPTNTPGQPTTYIVSGLKPDTTYVFQVRARNSHGIGVPSDLSDPINTRREYPNFGLHVMRNEWGWGAGGNIIIFLEVEFNRNFFHKTFLIGCRYHGQFSTNKAEQGGDTEELTGNCGRTNCRGTASCRGGGQVEGRSSPQ